MHQRPRLSLLVILPILAVACESRLTGKEGNLQFAYHAPGDAFDFNRPVAVNASLDLRVQEAVTRANVTLLEVDFSPEGVLAADGISGNTVVLVGVGEGRTEIRAEARLGSGEVVEDFVDMRARVATRLDLGHYCTDEDRALYLTAQQIWIPFSLYSERDERLIGYGYYPVAFTPDDAVTLRTEEKDQAILRLETGEVPGRVDLTSDIDDTTLEIELVSADAIDGLTAAVGHSPRVNHSTTIHFRPMVGEARVCQAILDFQVENLTPEICEIQLSGGEGEGHLFRELGVVFVEGRAEGTCRVEGALPDLGGGLSVEASVDIRP